MAYTRLMLCSLIPTLPRGNETKKGSVPLLQGYFAVNLGTGLAYSVLDMVKVFEAVNAQKVPYEVVNRRPDDIASCYASTDKAEQFLGWQAEYSLEDMMRDSWRWQSNNPNGY